MNMKVVYPTITLKYLVVSQESKQLQELGVEVDDMQFDDDYKVCLRYDDIEFVWKVAKNTVLQLSDGSQITVDIDFDLMVQKLNAYLLDLQQIME